ncbi:hypothetical protein [Reyranella sp.]|uniref:hypothetical protein n=1 Tax=Reyranella sp. TaxID=1929291 RepID=UPI003BA8CF1D
MSVQQDLDDFANLIARLPAEQQAALERARAAYNAAYPNAALATSEAYWRFVFVRASESYLVQYPEAP